MIVLENVQLYYNVKTRDDCSAAPRKNSKAYKVYERCIRITSLRRSLSQEDAETLEQFIRDVSGNPNLELVLFATYWSDATMIGVVQQLPPVPVQKRI